METESTFFYLSLCASHSGILRLRLIETEVLKQYDQMEAITMTVMSFCEINCKFQILQLLSLLQVLLALALHSTGYPNGYGGTFAVEENTLGAEQWAIWFANVEPAGGDKLAELIN